MFDNMTKRERLLATIVAFLVPVVLLFMVFFWFIGKYNDNEMKVIGLRSDIKKAQTLYDEAQQAKQRQVFYQELSLPSSLSKTDILLKEWVTELAAETKMKFVSLKHTDQRDIKSDARSPVKIGKLRTSSVRLEGKLDQIVEFLYKFYNQAALKRITSLQITPRAMGGDGPSKNVRSGRFSVDLDFDAVYLSDVESDKEMAKSTIALAHTFEDYLNRIGQRNVFAPANNAPVFPKTVNKSFEEGIDISLPVEAQDADEQDQLSFELINCSLPSATLTAEDGSRRATFKCSPLEIGEYKFSIRVFDNGNPSKDSTTDVSIAITKKRNNQPVLTAKTFEVYAGESIELELVATDKDGQVVKIEMFENNDLPNGSLTAVDGESRAIFSHPPIEETKNYEFEVKLDDGGDPRIRSGKPVDTTAKVVLTVLPAKFIVAAQTKITAIMAVNGVDKVWINVRPTGVLHDVAVGDSFEVDRKTWTVKSISVVNREVVLEVENVLKTYKFGDFLSEPRTESTSPGAPTADAAPETNEPDSETQSAVSKLQLEPTSASDK